MAETNLRIKKLVLNKETLRLLTRGDLEAVVGGLTTTGPTNQGTTTTCDTEPGCDTQCATTTN